MKTIKNKTILVYIASIITFLVLLMIPSLNILLGTYKWAMKQKAFWQGGVELIIFISLCCIINFVSKQSNKKIILIIGAIYLVLNGVIIPVVVDAIYLDVIFFIGSTLRGIKKKDNNLLFDFIMGVSVWGAGAIVCSLLGKGTVNDLCVFTLICFIVCLFICHNYKSSVLEITGKLIEDTTNKTSYVGILTLFVLLMLFAKTNSAFEYDSLWYGLRSDYVLIGNNSFYDNLGFAAFVYYYPKLAEFIMIPLNKFGDFSFITCVGVWILAMVLYLVKCTIMVVKKELEHLADVLVLIFSLIPAIANISNTAKPDIWGFFFVLLAVFCFYIYDENKNKDFISYGFVALALCTGTKLTYILWGGIPFILWLVLYVIKKRPLNDIVYSLMNNIILCVSSLFFVFGIHLRTYILTGYPIYPLALSVWEKIGFRPKEYKLYSDIQVGLLSDLSISELTKRVYQFIFNPTDLGHVIMLWTTNISFLFMFMWIIFKKKKKAHIYSALLCIVYFIFEWYYKLFMPVPDGNYFILPIVFVSVYFFINIDFDNMLSKRVYYLMAFIFVLTTTPITLVSHPSWAYGTKAFSNDVIPTNFDTENMRVQATAYRGVGRIDDYVKNYSKTDRVIVGGNSQLAEYWIHASSEGMDALYSQTLSNMNLVNDYNYFCDYINDINLKAFILFNEGGDPLIERYLSEHGYANCIVDDGATCYELR